MPKKETKKQSRKFLTVDEIKNAVIYGNHLCDHHLWSYMDEMIQDESLDMVLRSQASKKVYDIIGEDHDPSLSDEERVRKHIKDLEG